MLHKGNLSQKNKGSFFFFCVTCFFFQRSAKPLFLSKGKFGKTSQTKRIDRFLKESKERLDAFLLFFQKSWVIETFATIVLFFLSQPNSFRGFIQKYRYFSQEFPQKKVVGILDRGSISIKTSKGRFWISKNAWRLRRSLFKKDVHTSTR